MDGQDMTLRVGARCADCGLLRADDDDGLCTHCRLRRLLRSGLHHVHERYAATWVMLAVVCALLLFTLLLGAGSPQHGLLGRL
jgi:hypothetical protein